MESARAQALERARAALILAGHALDPDAPGGRDLEAAAIWLRHALRAVTASAAATTKREAFGTFVGPATAVARAAKVTFLGRTVEVSVVGECFALRDLGPSPASGDPIDGAEAVAPLDRRLLAEAAGSAERAEALSRALGGQEVPSLADLLDAELFVAKLIERAGGGRSLRRAERRRLAAAALAMVVASGIAAASLWDRSPRNDLHFRASSGAWGYNDSGTVNERRARGLFFHTAEQDNPWVEIELGGLREIQQVSIENRPDCCGERAIPLVVQLRDAAGAYREVARRDDPFNLWIARFPPQKATKVRLSVPRKTTFHLRMVEIE